jgi:acetylornithine deacetylase/succinyl-diaminopimelate desuccinylase-like protein
VIRDGKLYGRGGADDGYASFGSALSIKACQTLGYKHPRIIFLFEGDEESGSGHFEHYFEKLKCKFGNVKFIFCLDSGCINYD